MMEEAYWYIGITLPFQERNVAKRLVALSVEHYLPVQMVVKQYSDRRVRKETLVLPRMVFIHVTDQQRKDLFPLVPYLCSYMMDVATKKPAIVPAQELETFRIMVGDTERPITFSGERTFAVGEDVRVIAGPLRGRECRVVRIKNKSYLCVNLGIIGSAMVEIAMNDVEKIH